MGGTSLLGIDDSSDTGPLAFHDIAVLYRIARQGDAIAEALRRRSLPFTRAGHDLLTSRAPIADLTAELRRCLRSPGPASLGVDVRRDVGQKPVADLVVRIGALGPGDAAWRGAVELLATLSVPFGTDLAAFLDALPLLHETDLRLDTQKIALLTLHATKGLEFPLVFIAGCEDGLVPLQLPGLPTELEEERRLLYVGMTRARSQLVLGSARSRTLFGRKMTGAPCPFLGHLPSSLFDEVRLRERRRRRARQLSLL